MYGFLNRKHHRVTSSLAGLLLVNGKGYLAQMGGSSKGGRGRREEGRVWHLSPVILGPSVPPLRSWSTPESLKETIPLLSQI